MAPRSHGISLVEVMLAMVLLAMTILPVTLLITQATRNSVSTYVESSKHTLPQHLVDEMNPANLNFYDSYDMGTTKGTITDMGVTIPYLRRVETDTTKVSALRKRAYIYLYKNFSDPVSSPIKKYTVDLALDLLAIDVGATTFEDVEYWRSGQWVIDAQYDSTKARPGYISTNAGTAGSTATGISQVVDIDSIFQTYRTASAGTPLEYSIPVEAGNYVVELYFCEPDTTVTGSSPNRRRMDIYIGDSAFATLLAGSALITDFSPYEFTGSANRGTVLAFDVTVGSNRIINIALKAAASGTDRQPILSGISVFRR